MQIDSETVALRIRTADGCSGVDLMADGRFRDFPQAHRHAAPAGSTSLQKAQTSPDVSVVDLANAMADAIERLLDSMCRTPVGGGDGNTFVVTPPSSIARNAANRAKNEWRAAIAALGGSGSAGTQGHQDRPPIEP